MSEARKVSLFRNGRNQAVRIPVDFELPGDEATIRKEGDVLIIEPTVRTHDVLDYLRSLGPLSEADWFPDIDGDLPPIREIDL